MISYEETLVTASIYIKAGYDVALPPSTACTLQEGPSLLIGLEGSNHVQDNVKAMADQTSRNLVGRLGLHLETVALHNLRKPVVDLDY